MSKRKARSGQHNLALANHRGNSNDKQPIHHHLVLCVNIRKLCPLIALAFVIGMAKDAGKKSRPEIHNVAARQTENVAH